MKQNAKSYITTVSLTITNVRSNDFGTYLCVAKNSLGESDGTIKLSGILDYKETNFEKKKLMLL